jgi:DNA-binding CsgD family transcriptional regulator
VHRPVRDGRRARGAPRAYDPPAFYLTGSAFWLLDAGEWAAAERRAAQAAALVEGLERADWVRNQLVSIDVRLQLGRGALGPARDAAGALLRDDFSSESWTHGFVAQQVLATVSLAEGEPRRAERELGPLLERLSGADEPGVELDPEELVMAADVLVAAGRRPEAAALAQRLDRVFPSAWSSYCLAIAGPGRPAAVAEKVEAAASGLDGEGRRWPATMMRVLTATWLAGVSDGCEAAVALARAAMERFEAMGSEVWVRRMEEMLRRMGERAPTRAGTGAGGLSARELEVLGLVAEGLTNRQIAERLVISEHTAIRHVANVFRKLGVKNRAAAARIGAERGLIAPSVASGPEPE